MEKLSAILRLYLVEALEFFCAPLVLFFLRGQTADWSLAPLSLQVNQRL